jgi:hypothetical protein
MLMKLTSGYVSLRACGRHTPRARAATIAAALMAIMAAVVAVPVPATETADEDPWGDAPWPPVSGDADAEEAGGYAEPGGSDLFGASAFALYGTLTTAGEAQFGKAAEAARGEDLAVGTATRARIKGDWEPDERVLAHVELVGQHLSGVLNPYAYAQATGLDGGATTELTTASPQNDFANTLSLDQAWAQLRFDLLDLQVGKQPIAWGTGYAFNPTVRAHPTSGFSGFEDDATPGTAAISAGVPIAGSLTGEGYLAFEDRTHASFTTGREVDPAYLPWGGRVRVLVGGFDLAIGAIHEVVAKSAESAGPSGAALHRYLHVAGETVGSIGDLGVYAEVAWTMPIWDAPQAGTANWDALDALESTVGLEYVFPADVDAKLEYYRRGAGATDPDRYDPSHLLSGLSTVMARDYLFGYLGRTFLSYLDISVAVLGNLNDGSLLIHQQNEYAVSDHLTVSLSAMVPTGSGNQEFGGTREIGDTAVRFVRPTIMAGLEVSF